MVSLITSAAIRGNSSRPKASFVCSATRFSSAAAAAAVRAFIAAMKVESRSSVEVSMERPWNARV